jgi:hypothetical protein
MAFIALLMKGCFDLRFTNYDFGFERGMLMEETITVKLKQIL